MASNIKEVDANIQRTTMVSSPTGPLAADDIAPRSPRDFASCWPLDRPPRQMQPPTVATTGKNSLRLSPTPRSVGPPAHSTQWGLSCKTPAPDSESVGRGEAPGQRPSCLTGRSNAARPEREKSHTVPLQTATVTLILRLVSYRERFTCKIVRTLP